MTVASKPPTVSAPRMGGRPRRHAGQGEGTDPRPRRAGRGSPTDAVAGRGQAVRVRRAGGQGQPARPVRGPSPADRLPRLLRARRARVARSRVPGLFHAGRPGRSRRPPERPRHHAGLRVPRSAGRHRTGEGTDGLGNAVVHHRPRRVFDVDFGVDEWHGTNAFIRDGERVYRTYFINNRGDEAMGSVWSYLDITALGRQENWEDSPEGYPQSAPYEWWNWHDEYGSGSGMMLRRPPSSGAAHVRCLPRVRLCCTGLQSSTPKPSRPRC